MPVVHMTPDGELQVPPETMKKYMHYRFVRFAWSASTDGHPTKAILQGHNGKKWVRVKAKPGVKE